VIFDRLWRPAVVSVLVGIIVSTVAGCPSAPPPDRLGELGASSAAGSNLIVVLSDTHRLDHVTGFASGISDPTPNVARLMADGIAFSNALTPVPISAPAYATLMTGRSPIVHGLLNNNQHLGSELPLLQEELERAGYRTAAVVSNPFCSAAFGFDRGFGFFWDQVEGHGKEGEVVTREAISWLKANGDDRPFFLFLAYMDAHSPYISAAVPPSLRVTVNGVWLRDERAENTHVVQRYPVDLRPGRNRITLSFIDLGEPATPPEAPSPLHLTGLHLASGRKLERVSGVAEVEGTSFERLANRAELVVDLPDRKPTTDELVFRCHRRYRPEQVPALYEAGVRSFDTSFGHLLDHLRETGLYDDAIVVFVADHGEMLGEHDAWGHVEHLDQPTLRIPLVVKAPGVPGGRIDTTPLGLSDLHDLLLDLTLGPDPTRSEARKARRNAPFLAATYPPEGGSLQVAAIENGLKVLIDAAGATHAFNVIDDPDETADLLPARSDDPDIADLLGAASAELAAAAAVEHLELESLTADELDRLRALGYLEDPS